MTRTAAEREALRLARALLLEGKPGSVERAWAEDQVEASLPMVVESMRWAQAAERRRIRQAIRAARAEEVARWDALAERYYTGKFAEEERRTREDCARVVQGIDVALGAIGRKR